MKIAKVEVISYWWCPYKGCDFEHKYYDGRHPIEGTKLLCEKCKKEVMIVE